MNKALEHVNLMKKTKPRYVEPLKNPRVNKLDLIKGSCAIAEELGIDQATALKLIREGELPAFQIGNAYVIRREMLHSWVRLQELRTLAKRMK